MKTIIFDTGPIITLATNNLLGLFKELKRSFNGDFLITPAIKKEIIDRPLESKRYKFEAIQVLKQFQEGTFKIFDSTSIKEKTERLLFLSNNSFRAMGKYIEIVHYAEIEAVAAAIELKADAIIIDERTMRVLIENPIQVKERLEKKLHTNIEVNKENLDALKKELQGMTVLRSIELITIAYEKGFLDSFVLTNIKEPKKELLEGLLWGAKLAGCSVSEEEIGQLLRLEEVI